jgi:RNA polymerase sigma factor (TIGR02999 family)
VLEAYIRLVGVEKAHSWDSRGHFFSAAAEAMRRILVEAARRKNRVKHGGDHQRLDLDEGCTLADAPNDQLPALDAALTKLATEDPAKAELVKLRYFAGLTVDQAAELLGISRATAVRHWTYARAWLFDEIEKSD